MFTFLKKSAAFALITLIFSISTVTLADDDYVDQDASAIDPAFANAGPVVQINHSFTHDSGFYAQIQGLYNFSPKQADVQNVPINVPDQPSSRAATANETATQQYKTRGLGGRVSMGLDLGRYFSIEAGAFLNPRFKSSLTNPQPGKAGEKTDPNKIGGDMDKLSSYGGDVAVKMRIPFGDSLFAFVGGGMAWTHYSWTNLDDKATYFAAPSANTQAWTKRTPELLIGAGFALTTNMAVTAQYTHMFGSGDTNIQDLFRDLRNATSAATVAKAKQSSLNQNIIYIGLEYKF